MSLAAAFDTLGYFEKLTLAGMPEAQARVQVEAMQDVINSYDAASRKDFATKTDLKDFATKTDLAELAARTDLHAEIQSVSGGILAVHNEIHNVKHEILKWLLALFVAQTALLVGLLPYIR